MWRSLSQIIETQHHTLLLHVQVKAYWTDKDCCRVTNTRLQQAVHSCKYLRDCAACVPTASLEQIFAALLEYQPAPVSSKARRRQAGASLQPSLLFVGKAGQGAPSSRTCLSQQSLLQLDATGSGPAKSTLSPCLEHAGGEQGHLRYSQQLCNTPGSSCAQSRASTLSDSCLCMPTRCSRSMSGSRRALAKSRAPSITMGRLASGVRTRLCMTGMTIACKMSLGTRLRIAGRSLWIAAGKLLKTRAEGGACLKAVQGSYSNQADRGTDMQ